MSHDAALFNTELIEDLVDHRSPFRNTASRFAMRCLSPPKSPPAQFSANELIRGKIWLYRSMAMRRSPKHWAISS